MNKFILFIALNICFQLTHAQVGLTETVLLNASPNADGTITLKWPKSVFAGKYSIYKNVSANAMQFPSASVTVPSTDSTWTDLSFTSGSRAEYAVLKLNASNQLVSIGYIEAGNKTKEIPSHGSIILVIDSNYIKPLSAEIATLINDLETNGYPVFTIYAGRKEKPQAIKDRMKVLWENIKPTPQYLYLLGHIPVPYSGNYTGKTDRCAFPPDGHVEGSGNHTGAWPADPFYGDYEGFWTDNSVNITTGSLSRNHNTPGDGKYDQCSPASLVTMKIGRVDLFDMPIFNKSDTVLVREYLKRAHDWKINGIPFVRHGLIDDNFTGLDLSGTGWNTMASCMRIDSIFQRDYFTSQNTNNYWWSYGCGAGSFTNCSGVGGVNNFNPGVFKNIFTALAGSFFGDWDVTNNFLRAPLAAGSLCSFWGGIPKWYTQYFGLGKPLGFCAQVTQNNTDQSFNGSENKNHITLLGDPTLTALTVPPAGKLTASSSASKVNLSWAPATGKFDGYCIYRIDTVYNRWFRVNTAIITSTSFTDAINWNSGKYKYAVRTIRLDTTGSGSYYTLGGGTFAWVNHTNSAENIEKLQFDIYPNPSSGKFTLSNINDFGSKYGLTISDISGRLVAEYSKIELVNNQFSLDLSHLNPGIYMVTLGNGNQKSTLKLQMN